MTCPLSLPSFTNIVQQTREGTPSLFLYHTNNMDAPDLSDGWADQVGKVHLKQTQHATIGWMPWTETWPLMNRDYGKAVLATPEAQIIYAYTSKSHFGYLNELLEIVGSRQLVLLPCRCITKCTYDGQCWRRSKKCDACHLNWLWDHGRDFCKSYGCHLTHSHTQRPAPIQITSCGAHDFDTFISFCLEEGPRPSWVKP